MQATSASAQATGNNQDTKSISDNPDEWRHSKRVSQSRIITSLADQNQPVDDKGCSTSGSSGNRDVNNNGEGVDKENMGSNVSRHSSAKGLSGRRSLSSGKWLASQLCIIIRAEVAGAA